MLLKSYIHMPMYVDFLSVIVTLFLPIVSLPNIFHDIWLGFDVHFK